MAIVTKTELVQSDIEVFGHYEAACIARRKKVLFTHFHWMAFGVPPKRLAAPPTPVAQKLREILRNDARGHIGAVSTAARVYPA